MATFDYVLERIRAQPFRSAPFKHLYIDGLFSGAHFAAIVSAREINVRSASRDDAELFDELLAAGYEMITFPGCTGKKARYIAWHAERSREVATIHSACEGLGAALRLKQPTSDIIAELDAFLQSQAFVECLAEKFEMSLSDKRYNAGLQKYLDGYEISPHPDIRKKALTFMVNINPHPNADRLIHHTHYLRFSEAYRFVEAFWRAHPEVDRCWVPWDWCETSFVQTMNNSMVAFAPDDDTIHAVKAAYDHFEGQRTQLYGNIWRSRSPARSKLEWEELQQIHDASPI